MRSLEELVQMEGVGAACEYAADGTCVDYRSKLDIPRELAERATQYIATVTMLFNTMAGAFTKESQMSWVPQKLWTYSGGDWTVVAGPRRAVFAETDKADIQELSCEMMSQPQVAGFRQNM